MNIIEKDFVKLHDIQINDDGTVVMPRDTFDILIRKANLTCRMDAAVKSSREMKNTILNKVIDWIRLNPKSDKTKLDSINGKEYIVVNSHKAFDEILCELGISLSATQLLKCLGDEELLHNKGRYALNRPDGNRVIVLTATANYVSEYRLLSKAQ